MKTVRLNKSLPEEIADEIIKGSPSIGFHRDWLHAAIKRAIDRHAKRKAPKKKKR